ncbi:MAG: hypothetical protein K0S47_930 [Herbinix sp.]|jgi:uncharacterized SAM-binding protein YcdF (DUF218 family)|nr:hypothetical protein [Herbinix sp.]
MGVLFVLSMILGSFCLLYYGVIILYAGSKASFAWFWLLGGIACILAAICIRYLDQKEIVIPKLLKGLVITGIILGVVVFSLLEGNLLYHANQKPDTEAKYLIVLGAQVKGTRVSKSLQKRLDAAWKYLNDNPETIAIVSGGQGTGEDITEAEAMKEYLLSKGIDEKRILKEDQSTNTYENIHFSMKIIENDTESVVIVTNGFHIFRALQIAKKQGLSNVTGLSAPTDKILFINYYIREAAAVLKDGLFGNM